MSRHQFSWQELQAHCRTLPPMMAESHYRRYVARNPHDLNGWTELVRCLKDQHNYVEAGLTVDHFMQKHGSGDAGKRFAILSYFQIGDHAKAQWLATRLVDRDFSKRPVLARIVSLLQDLAGRDGLAVAQVAAAGPADQGAIDGVVRPLSGVAHGPEVAFLLKYDWHHSIQKGIAAHLGRAGVRCLFLRTVWEVVAAKPKVLVVSDALGADRIALAHYLPNCWVVYTRHGLGDKNYAAHAAGQAHVTCVSSAAVADEFAAQFVMDRARLWVTGFPQMDDLFQRLASPQKTADRGRTVLVAPTFTEGLNAADVLGKDLVASVRGADESIRVMIRPHPHSRKLHAGLLQVWSEQAARLPGVSLHEGDDLNLMDLFAAADVMVSDVSSAGLAWLATGRPLVCLTDAAKAKLSPFFAPEGLEWRMHKAAVHVQDVAALRGGVSQALKAQGQPNADYLALRHHLFGGLTDGRASERVAMRIKQWLDGQAAN
jgi:hypothetical protein